MEALVSILTPFKNTQNYIEECVESIQKQTYTNWELILVNDHSEDQSLNIVKSIAAKDNRIKVYSNSGSGIIDALRLAYQNSQGRFITRMDSDDIMQPNKLEVLMGKLIAFGPGHVAIGLVKYVSNKAISEGYKTYENWLNTLTEMGSNFKEIYKECAIPSPCWMIYKEDLQTCGAFNEDRYPEDYDLTFRFYEHGFKCIPCNQVLHLWRDYNTRTSRIHLHYSVPYFLDVKLHYFLKIDYQPQKTLVIWGVGDKGKHLAKRLNEKDIDYSWISAHPEKIGKTVGSKIIESLDTFQNITKAQHIITFANPKSQQEITLYFENIQLQIMQDFFFFC